VLVDCDNIASTKINLVFEELRLRRAETKIRLLFGNFRLAKLKPWLVTASEWSFDKVETPSDIKGKSSVDATLMITAMKIHPEVDCFAIVSSDSDFTPLVSHLRKSGKYVIGFGMNQTPLPFVKACNDFNYLDNVATIVTEDERKDMFVAGFDELKKIVEVLSNENEGWTTPAKVVTRLSNSARKELGISRSNGTEFFQNFGDVFQVSRGSIRLKPLSAIESEKQKLPNIDPIDVQLQHPHPLHYIAPLHVNLKFIIENNHSNSYGWIRLLKVGALMLKSDRDELISANKTLLQFLNDFPETYDLSTKGDSSYINHIYVRMKPSEDDEKTSPCSPFLDRNALIPNAVPLVERFEAFERLKAIIESGTDINGWTHFSVVKKHLERIDKQRLSIYRRERDPTCKQLASHFDTLSNIFGVVLEVRSNDPILLKPFQSDKVSQEGGSLLFDELKSANKNLIHLKKESADSFDLSSQNKSFPNNYRVRIKSPGLVEYDKEANPSPPFLEDEALASLGRLINIIEEGAFKKSRWTPYFVVKSRLQNFDKVALGIGFQSLTTKRLTSFFNSCSDRFGVTFEKNKHQVRLKVLERDQVKLRFPGLACWSNISEKVRNRLKKERIE